MHVLSIQDTRYKIPDTNVIYSPGNAAKQWILANIEKRFFDQRIRILDLACGTAWVWEQFIKAHPNVHVVGIDMDASAITEGKKKYEGASNIDLHVFDAQSFVNDPNSELRATNYDFVVALSAIEHVVDREAFLKTVWDSLKPGGIAYLNYDAGHFRSRNIKERLMVPISQLLAVIGIERFYMKRVDDAVFRNLAEKQGFRLVETRKHNIATLKGFMKSASMEAIESWYGFEERLGALYAPDALDRIMLSTTVVLEKP
jgi:SAM-dependent methyltransferase